MKHDIKICIAIFILALTLIGFSNINWHKILKETKMAIIDTNAANFEEEDTCINAPEL